jgi:hypothetical protein
MCTEGTKARRERLHELLLALIAQQADLELMDADGPMGLIAASWMERNRRVLQRYQSLVITAVTLDALVDAETSTVSEVNEAF